MLLALGPTRPPMVDLGLVPAALLRPAISSVEFGSGADVLELRRVVSERLPRAASRRQATTRAGSSDHAWVLTDRGRTDTCNTAAVGAYLAFLVRAEFTALQDPRSFEQTARWIRLHYSDKSTDLIELEASASPGPVIARSRPAGLVGTLSHDVAALLLPAATVLLDVLPPDSPYLAGLSE